MSGTIRYIEYRCKQHYGYDCYCDALEASIIMFRKHGHTDLAIYKCKVCKKLHLGRLGYYEKDSFSKKRRYIERQMKKRRENGRANSQS
jgi:hypothetical protein